ncbi:hypothetical protein SPSIL_043360 [Sporomusa silvacetica DSM 10669]|uniref:Outer membrane protein (OmpH-like) n=1 Tax=Sporomusa silvacetica DSM 10669 TaxID=1123289 RepID=A0ABZ3IRD2_9FIRM|nr:outer membrane protein (OmpH-like) [Sporomusa silvacetica DSM 10669]
MLGFNLTINKPVILNLNTREGDLVFTTKKQTTPIRFLVILILSTVLFAGCSRSATPETKPPEVPQVGVIDMDKAINAHPKYQEWQKLKQQAATLRQQLSGQVNQARNATEAPAMDLQGSVANGLQTAAAQEFNAKMAAKQQELQAKLVQKADKVHGELSVELKAYAQELDKEYQPQIFNQQLKLQTVRLDEKQTAEEKKILDALKAEQANKLAAKEKELGQSLDALLAPEKAAIEQELAAYAQQVNAELNAKTVAQTANMSTPIAQAVIPPDGAVANKQLEQQLGMKQQEINVLEETILNDVRDKTAKVAIERHLDTVLTGYQVNVKAVDITNAVIAAFKK